MVRAALGGLALKASSGFFVHRDKANHHLHKSVVIGLTAPDRA